MSIIFVVGSPRSGTTYLSRALGLAENASYLGESELFCLSAVRIDHKNYSSIMMPKNIFPYNRLFMCGFNMLDSIRHKDRVKDAAEHLIRMSKVQAYDLKPSNTLYKVQNIELDKRDLEDLADLSHRWRLSLHKNGISEYAQSYFDEYARRKSCETVIEKTPLHLRYLPVLHAVFPDAKVVMICRDKKDCLRSYTKTFGKGPGINRFLPKSLAARKVWSELLADEKREQWAVKQSWIKKIEFNDYVQKPVDVLKPVLNWLELDFDFEKYTSEFPEYKQRL